LKTISIYALFAGIKWFHQVHHWMEAWFWELEIH